MTLVCFLQDVPPRFLDLAKWPCACCMCPRGDLRPCLALGLGNLKNGLKPTGSRGELQALDLEANFVFWVSCRRTGTASNHSFSLPYTRSLPSVPCFMLLLSRALSPSSLCSPSTHARMPLPWCSCRPRGPSLSARGPLVELDSNFMSGFVFGMDNHELMFPGTDRFLGCRLQGANDSTCLLNLTTFVPGRIS